MSIIIFLYLYQHLVLNDLKTKKNNHFILCHYWIFKKKKKNLLLIEREGCTGEYWPEVVTVRTEHREGRYSPVRLEQARLVSSLLYGTRGGSCYVFCFQTYFRSVKFKGLPARDDAS